MNREEARAVAKKRLEQLRELSYEELLRRYYTGGGKEPEWETDVGSSGTLYHLRLETFWDIAEKPRANLRVWVEAEDGSDDGFAEPEVATFIIAPDGSFPGK